MEWNIRKCFVLDSPKSIQSRCCCRCCYSRTLSEEFQDTCLLEVVGKKKRMWKEVYSEKSDREKFLTKGISFSNRTMSEEGRRGKSKKFPTLNIGYRTGIKILPKITNGTEHWTFRWQRKCKNVKINGVGYQNFTEITRAIVTYDLLTPARFQSLLMSQSANLSLIIHCRKKSIRR